MTEGRSQTRSRLIAASYGCCVNKVLAGSVIRGIERDNINMKTTLRQLILFLGLLLAFAASARAEESHRGLFEADLTGGGKAVFFVQGNHALSVYVFDSVSNTASFAGGGIATDDSFSIKTNKDDTISGSIHDDDPVLFDDDSVAATVAGQTITAARVSTFGPSDDIPGRFAGTGDEHRREQL